MICHNKIKIENARVKQVIFKTRANQHQNQKLAVFRFLFFTSSQQEYYMYWISLHLLLKESQNTLQASTERIVHLVLKNLNMKFLETNANTFLPQDTCLQFVSMVYY